MNLLRTVRYCLGNHGRQYSKSLSNSKILHSEELDILKIKIKKLIIHVNQRNKEIEILRMKFNNFEKYDKYYTLPKLQCLQRIINKTHEK